MSPLREFFLVFVAFTGSATAADSSLSFNEQCANSCEQNILNDSTSTSNATVKSLCAIPIQLAWEECLFANCTVKESFTAKRSQAHQCNIPTHHGRPAADPALIVPLAIATLLVVARLASKCMHVGGGWWWDDYTIIVAYILAVFIFAMNASMIHHGFGKDIWTITPFDNITIILKRFYIYVLAYKAQISLAKISVCLFLLRIFRSPAFRYTAYTIIALNTAIAMTWVLVDALRCNPIHLAWTGWAKEEPGKCIDFIAATFANSFVNIAVDTVMVIMPIYEVIKLNLDSRRKLGVGVMFAMGLILTVVAILRVVVFYFNRWNKNPTVELQPINVWSVVECQIAVVCACLPAARALLLHFFPGMMGGSGRDSDARRATHTIASSVPKGRGKISQTVSYSVDYSRRPQDRASNSAIHLVELDQVDE
ncbi:hypothetical protein BDV25DRAFT_138508 [Aspergillus avenaceus]|uniref:Rhodopsin domain-containing protein n=1 Tax=Aspergillus avenaceus TaxID=36643 RepID=A0A5N6TZT2_ASPAV|nr:hypothetical protein BDV25DRAFT_138508 [Aspergillus avenaceus]